MAKMNIIEVLQAPYKVYKAINEALFNNELDAINIQITKSPKEFEGIACYNSLDNSICITHYFIDSMELFTSRKQQIEYYVRIMLHEMVHKYCHLKGIDAENHNANFMRVAKEHALDSIYEGGELVHEELLPAGKAVVDKLYNQYKSFI